MTDCALISRLPLHLVSRVLGRLDTVRSLGITILTHPLFYVAYKEATQAILHDILMYQMHYQIGTLYFAVTAYEADRIDHTDSDEVQEFLRDHLKRLSLGPGSAFGDYTRILKPEVAAVLSRTQHAVNYFTAGFVATTASRCPEVLEMAKSRDWHECSDREIFRIQRALYRYQTHCNLFFRSVEDLAAHVHFTSELNPSVLDTRKQFFTSHSPWENEQLASVLDYLEIVLSRAFDVVAEHDIAWGYFRVDWIARGGSNKRKQTYLSRGLMYLYELDLVDDYFSRYQTLTRRGYSSEDAYSPLKTVLTAPSIMKILYDYSYWARLNLEDEGDLTAKELRQLQSRGPATIFDDSLSDPAAMWLLLHHDEHPNLWLDNDMYVLARRSGYVIWDIPSRHPADGDFENRLKASCHRYIIMQHQSDRIAKESKGLSWRLRDEAYRRGVRGGFVPEMLLGGSAAT